MRRARWIVPSTIGSIVLTTAVLALFASRTPGFSVVGLLGALVVTAAGMGVAGIAHSFAHRLIARRPWGTYLYGVVIGEAYLVTIMGALTIAKLLGAPGLVRPGLSDPFADWRHWPVVAASGVIVGLLWGFLSRNEVSIGSDD
jgi:hypothetical protein